MIKENKLTFSTEYEYNDYAAKEDCHTCIDWQGPDRRCPKHTVCTEENKGRYKQLTYQEWKDLHGPKRKYK